MTEEVHCPGCDSPFCPIHGWDDDDLVSSLVPNYFDTREEAAEWASAQAKRPIDP